MDHSQNVSAVGKRIGLLTILSIDRVAILLYHEI